MLASSLIAFLPLLAPAAQDTEPAGALAPERLRCESRVDPLGIDVREPRLSWIVTSNERGQKQSAYQVLVASDASKLAPGDADLWDSGKVESSDSIAVAYAGKPLGPHAWAHWRVRVWDTQGRPSPWSAPALWSMGPLVPEEWKAEWIGFDKPRTDAGPVEADFVVAEWIWHAADPDAAPAASRLFAAELPIPEDAEITKATLLVTADDAFRYAINGQVVAEGGAAGFKEPKQVDVTGTIRKGKNILRAVATNGSEGPAGLIAWLDVTTADGRRFASATTSPNYYHSTDAVGDDWATRPIDLATIPDVRVLAPYGAAPWGKLTLRSLILPPPRLLRTTFRVEKPVVRATATITALGLVDVYLGGSLVTEEYFLPGWTDYTKRVLYRTYDVTDRIAEGPNAIGLVLSDGWYSGYVGFGNQRDHYGKKIRALVQVRIEHPDGSATVVGTGPGWKASTGSILEGDFLMGETVDARKTPAGWVAPDFDDSAWVPVDVGTDEVNPALQWHPGPPVRAVGEFQAKTITEPTPGVYVLDLGRNFAGVPRLQVGGKPGQVIRLRFAERLNPDGTIYTTNLRSARATDTFILGDSAAGPNQYYLFQPRTTFHGFQYIEVTGLDGPPKPDTVVGVALSSDTSVVGVFDSSDPMLNQLHSNIFWTQRANFIDIPTDCPQRDERLGWTGDAQVYIRTASLNTDVQAFFTKWLQDLVDGQRADGQFPMIAPVKVAGDDGGPAWADAGTVCPWTIYQVYGDRRLLERQYPSMVRYVEFLRARSKDSVLPPDQFHAFGDWLSINADTPKEVIYTAYFALSARLTAQAAVVLGKADDAANYHQLYDAIKKAFNDTYVAPDGRIKGDTQACYVLALAMDLVEGEQAAKAAEYLVADIEKRDNHLSTGFVGTKDLMLVLSKIGREDVAYRLLHNVTFPSWGFSIEHGATSIWERWDGWTPEKGFQDPGMNSFAHYSFGAVYGWMVENIGGIRGTSPAYATFDVAPRLDPNLTHARIAYDSVRGPIVSSWRREGDTLTLEVTVPANATATVIIPSADPSAVREGGLPLGEAQGVSAVKATSDAARVEIGSGSYVFTSPLK